MKRLMLAVAVVLCLAVSAFAADVWQYKVLEISKPGLTDFVVRFEIVLNSESYATDQITVAGSELEGKTLVQRKDYLNTKVKERIAPYIAVYNTYSGLDEVVGQTYTAQ